jgi:hypothetical protein
MAACSKGAARRWAAYRLRVRWPTDAAPSCSTTPTASARCWASWTPGCWPKARTCGRSNAGRHAAQVEGVAGTGFAVWAPNALAGQRGRRLQHLGRPPPPDAAAPRVRRVGDLPARRGRRRALQVRAARRAGPSAAAEGRPLYARQAELRPATASVVAPLPPVPPRRTRHGQRAGRADEHLRGAPGLWRRKPERATAGSTGTNWPTTLVPYAADMGFTHLELLPISEHPFDGSWGYQPLGLYAPTARFGDPAGFRRFVQRAHAAGLGVILDWVPAHFPTDEHGLARFDGTHLYEYADPREGFHNDWNTLIYNFGRTEVRNFLVGNALYWLERFGVDGLRVDAVASMLYRDYSRKAGEWIPNVHGGRENLEAIAFLKRANEVVGSERPAGRHAGRGVHRVPGRVAAHLRGRPGLPLQVEHGLDARHAAVHGARPDPPQPPPGRADLRADVRLQRELRAAAVARRGGARQGLAAGQDAGRPLAAVRQPAGLLRLHVGPPGQEAAVHGLRVCAAARVEPRHQPGLAPAATTRRTPACSAWCAT